jgi:hypothetical protein
VARDWEDAGGWDAELCMECGEDHYVPSRVPGLCKSCADPVTVLLPYDSDNEDEAD